MIGHTLVGSGPEKVVVLHGWFGDSSVYEPVLPFLNHEAFSYAFMDIRGYGRSKTVTGQHTIAEIGGDVLELAEQLGWERFHLVGHSMGGMVIQWLAGNAPKRILRMIGVTPVPASGFPMDGDTEALFRGAAQNVENRAAILMHTTGNRLASAFGKVMTERSFVQTTPDAFDDYLTAWMKTDFSAQVQGNPTPFKVLVGQHDPAVTADFMRGTVLKWFPQAELEIIPNAGHYPMIETPVHLATVCEAFLLQKTPTGVA